MPVHRPATESRQRVCRRERAAGRILPVLLLSLLSLLLWSVAGAKVLNTALIGEQQSLLPYCSWLIDPDGDRDITDIASGEAQKAFIPLSWGMPLKGGGPAWFRLTLVKDLSDNGVADEKARLSINLGRLPPGENSIYFSEYSGPVATQGIWHSEQIASYEDILLPQPRQLPVSVYIRMDELPDLWFAPVVRAHGMERPSMLPPALLLPGFFIVAGFVCLLRAIADRALWACWAALFFACMLVQSLLPLPGVRQPFTFVHLPALLAPGLSLILLPHIGRCIFSSPPLSGLEKFVLSLCTLSGLAVALVPLLPGMSWLIRLFPLWPVLLALLFPPCMGFLASGRSGSLGYGAICVLGLLGGVLAVYGLRDPGLHPLTSQAPLWGIALGGLLFSLVGVPRNAKDSNGNNRAAGSALLLDVPAATRGEAAFGAHGPDEALPSLETHPPGAPAGILPEAAVWDVAVQALPDTAATGGTAGLSPETVQTLADSAATADMAELSPGAAPDQPGQPDGVEAESGMSFSLNAPAPQSDPADGPEAGSRGPGPGLPPVSCATGQGEILPGESRPVAASADQEENAVPQPTESVDQEENAVPQRAESAHQEEHAVSQQPGGISGETEAGGASRSGEDVPCSCVASAAEAGEHGIAGTQGGAEAGPADGSADAGTTARNTEERPDEAPGADAWLSMMLPAFVGQIDNSPASPAAGARMISLLEETALFRSPAPLDHPEEFGGLPPARGKRPAPDESYVFNLHGLVREVHDVISPLAASKELMFSWYIAPDVPVLLEGDAPRLRGALSLLLQNAVQATSRGVVQLSVRGTPGASSAGNLLFSINDSGSAERTDAGFFHAWELAARSGGSFNVEYSPGSGTQVTFTARFGLPSEETAEAHYSRHFDREEYLANVYLQPGEDEEDALIPVLHAKAAGPGDTGPDGQAEQSAAEVAASEALPGPAGPQAEQEPEQDRAEVVASEALPGPEGPQPKEEAEQSGAEVPASEALPGPAGPQMEEEAARRSEQGGPPASDAREEYSPHAGMVLDFEDVGAVDGASAWDVFAESVPLSVSDAAIVWESDGLGANAENPSVPDGIETRNPPPGEQAAHAASPPSERQPQPAPASGDAPGQQPESPAGQADGSASGKTAAASGESKPGGKRKAHPAVIMTRPVFSKVQAPSVVSASGAPAASPAQPAPGAPFSLQKPEDRIESPCSDTAAAPETSQPPSGTTAGETGEPLCPGGGEKPSPHAGQNGFAQSQAEPLRKTPAQDDPTMSAYDDGAQPNKPASSARDPEQEASGPHKQENDNERPESLHVPSPLAASLLEAASHTSPALPDPAPTPGHTAAAGPDAPVPAGPDAAVADGSPPPEEPEPPASGAATKAARAHSAPPGAELPRIVIAETTTSNRRLVAHYLADIPHEHLDAQDNARVLEFFGSAPLSLIIFDGDMPEQDIVAAIKAVRAKEEQREALPVPILCLTGHRAQSGRLIEAGATVALTKPFSRDAFLASVARAAPRLIPPHSAVGRRIAALEGGAEAPNMPASSAAAPAMRAGQATAPARSGTLKAAPEAGTRFPIKRSPLAEGVLGQKADGPGAVPGKGRSAVFIAPEPASPRMRVPDLQSKNRSSMEAPVGGQAGAEVTILQEAGRSKHKITAGKIVFSMEPSVAAASAPAADAVPEKIFAGPQNIPLPGLDGESLDAAVMPLVPGLLLFLEHAYKDALRGREQQKNLLVQESSGRLAARAEAFSLRRLGRVARCVERAAEAEDSEAVDALLEDLRPVLDVYLKSLNEAYGSFTRIKY